MDHAAVKTTANASVAVQVATGAVCLAVLLLNLPADSSAAAGDSQKKKKNALWAILFLETVVQSIELVMYVFFMRGITLQAMARVRYHDWALTTPLMLVSIAAYMDLIDGEEAGRPRGGDGSRESGGGGGLPEFLRSEWKHLAAMALANAGMLLAGYAAERGALTRSAGAALGFAAFIATMSILWRRYAKRTARGRRLFAFVSVTWAIYGAAFMLDPASKNVAYNLLDVVAKNFFGLFLAWHVINA